MKNTVTLEFNGKNAEEIAEKVYYLFVDGGMEDQIIEFVSETCELDIEPDGCDNEKHITKFVVK